MIAMVVDLSCFFPVIVNNVVVIATVIGIRRIIPICCTRDIIIDTFRNVVVIATVIIIIYGCM